MYKKITIATAAVLVSTAITIAIVLVFQGDESSFQEPILISSPEFLLPVTPFQDISRSALRDGFEVWNDRPGIVVFDYDRDGDHDLYITSEVGHANWLYVNAGNGTFIDLAASAGVTATNHNSTGAIACDIDNDGYQDLYVGAWGVKGDNLDFRSHLDEEFSKDLLYRNNADGTFQDITDSAFGDQINLRSTSSIGCADVNGDGWLDIFVGNLADDDFRDFRTASHSGHFNMLYINNGDLTFTEMAQKAGVDGSQIVMRDKRGNPITFEDPQSGKQYEGYDPTVKDERGHRVGDPTGQTHAVLFLDYDSDGDQDLWVANDGDILHLFRNDSTPTQVRFISVSHELGIDKVGSWMGFAVGDYDGDQDLDIFVSNVGYHSRTRKPRQVPNGSCAYHEQFKWGTCLHFLLRNKHEPASSGILQSDGFENVASSTYVMPSSILPPDSITASNIHPSQEVPTGLAAYDFGFGTTFFDFDNDGDLDLYWLGSTVGRGEGPGGDVFPSAGRMLRGDGRGNFQDITVESRLLDIYGVNYDMLGEGFPEDALRIDNMLHENGKGLAHGDLNGDGYVDLIGTNSSSPKFKNDFSTDLLDAEPAPGPVFVWLNGGGDNHWITLHLIGRMAIDRSGSNADGIGAKVYVKANVNNQSVPSVQIQEVRAGSSYLSMDSIDLEFGLGLAKLVDEITILWPSGRRQVIRDVTADQVLVITEPKE